MKVAYFFASLAALAIGDPPPVLLGNQAAHLVTYMAPETINYNWCKLQTREAALSGSGLSLPPTCHSALGSLGFLPTDAPLPALFSAVSTQHGYGSLSHTALNDVSSGGSIDGSALETVSVPWEQTVCLSFQVLPSIGRERERQCSADSDCDPMGSGGWHPLLFLAYTHPRWWQASATSSASSI